MPELRDLQISIGKTLPARLLSVRYSRSGGPGGQNVNKVETKVDLRLDLDAAIEFLGTSNVNLIREKLANRIDASGGLRIVGDEYREQGRNLDAALVRMESLVRSALHRPRKRRPTKPTRGSNERRLGEKKIRGQIKSMRSKPAD